MIKNRKKRERKQTIISNGINLQSNLHKALSVHEPVGTEGPFSTLKCSVQTYALEEEQNSSSQDCALPFVIVKEPSLFKFIEHPRQGRNSDPHNPVEENEGSRY